MKDFIEYHFFEKSSLETLDTKKNEYTNTKLNLTIKGIGGITKLENAINIIKEKKDAGDDVIFIFDADSDYNNGGFSIRKKFVEDILKKHLIEDYDFFLFPNNKDDGDLEDLLSQIIDSKHSNIFECWEGYEKCLSGKSSNYTLPARKTRIYAYLEALLGKSNKNKEMIKEQNRDYKNEDHWNLSHIKAQPLKVILERYFSQ